MMRLRDGLLNLVRSAKLDAKIDSELGTVVMEPPHPDVYEQIIENTKALAGRTYKLVHQVLEAAPAPAA